MDPLPLSAKEAKAHVHASRSAARHAGGQPGGDDARRLGDTAGALGLGGRGGNGLNRGPSGGGLVGGGGGGGSGFGPAGVVFQSGVRAGNGLVTITYTVHGNGKYAHLADLTREYVRQHGLDRELVDDLDSAERSEGQGDRQAKAVCVRAYIQHVAAAQRIGALSAELADELTRQASVP